MKAFGISLKCLLLLAVILLPTSHASAAAPPVNDTWVDEFSSTTLNPHWSWFYETTDHWSLTANPGYMRITTLADTAGFNNMMVTYAPLGNFSLETQVVFEPTENFQIASLVVYFDDSNYIQFGRAFCGAPEWCVGNGIYFDHIEGGAYLGTNFATATPTSPGNAYLKLVRRGNVYSGYFSPDGTAWILIGQHTANYTTLNGPLYVGIQSSNQTAIPVEIYADFNYVKLTTLNGWHDDFYNEPLNPRWSWYDEVPDHWSLSDYPGFMTMTTQSGIGGIPNYLYTAMPANLSQVDTRVIFTPSENFQIASIMLFLNESNSLQLGRAYCGFGPPNCTNGTGIYFDYLRNGRAVGSNFALAVPEGEFADYLRIMKIGNRYYGYFSPDGANWTLVGSHRVMFTPRYIGIRASAQAPFAIGEEDALFDFVSVFMGPRVISISPR